MSRGFIVGAGGASLNFKVVGGLEEPADPKDQTLWIKTDVKIKSYYFAAAAPNEPEEGCVWISTWIQSPQAFNVLKKNTLLVYPSGCQQYIGGAWVSKELLVRFGAEWVSTTRYLITKGFETKQFTISGTQSGVSRYDDYIYINSYCGSYSYGYYFMYPDPVDLSSFSNVQAEAYYQLVGSVGGAGRVVVCTSPTGSEVASASLSANAYGTTKLDISKLSGEYYVGFFGSSIRSGAADGSGGDLYIKNLCIMA